MRILDDKGRVFGIINIFDLLVFCVIAAIAVFAFRWSKIADDPSWIKVRLTQVRCVGVMQVPSYVAPLVKVGDETVDENNVTMARIVKIMGDEANPVATFVSKDGEKLFFNQDVRNITVEVIVSAYEKKGEVYSARTNEPLKVGVGVAMTPKRYSSMVIVHKILDEGNAYASR